MDCLIPPAACAPADWAEQLKSLAEPVFLLGDGACLYQEIWEQVLGGYAQVLPPLMGLIRGSFVAMAARQRLQAGYKQDFYSAVPFYLRGI